MSSWTRLTEPEKLAAVAAAVRELEDLGVKATGDRIASRIGTTGRTGRTYLHKLQDASPAQVQPTKTALILPDWQDHARDAPRFEAVRPVSGLRWSHKLVGWNRSGAPCSA